MAGIDGSSFKRDFEVALALKLLDSNSCDSHASYHQGQEVILYSLYVLDHFTYQYYIMHVVAVRVRQIYGSFYGNFDACANSVYQALSPPLKGPGGRGYIQVQRQIALLALFFFLYSHYARYPIILQY